MQSSTVSSTQQQGIFSAAPQRAATAQGGRRHLSLPPPCEAAGPTASRFPFRAAGRFRCRTCRLRPWRHATRVSWGACRHDSFDISFGWWSFLTFHFLQWSGLSKIRHSWLRRTDRAVRQSRVFYLARATAAGPGEITCFAGDSGSSWRFHMAAGVELGGQAVLGLVEPCVSAFVLYAVATNGIPRNLSESKCSRAARIVT